MRAILSETDPTVDLSRLERLLQVHMLNSTVDPGGADLHSTPGGADLYSTPGGADPSHLGPTSDSSKRLRPSDLQLANG